MIKVVVTGGTPDKRAHARRVVKWVAENKLFINRDVRINVRFKDLNGTHCGEAYHVAPSSFKSKSFTMVIANEIDFEKECTLLSETIIHEFVHVWQMASRIVRYKLSPNRQTYKSFWKGRDMTNTAYSRQPWERQAYRLEKKFLSEFLAIKGECISFDI